MQEDRERIIFWQDDEETIYYDQLSPELIRKVIEVEELYQSRLKALIEAREAVDRRRANEISNIACRFILHRELNGLIEEQRT